MLPDQQKLADAEATANSAVAQYYSDSNTANTARGAAAAATTQEEASRVAAATAILALDAVVVEFEAAIGPVPAPTPAPADGAPAVAT